MNRLLRRDDLCDGAEQCHKTTDMVCNDCGETTCTPNHETVAMEVHCGHCRSGDTEILPCANCPVALLNQLQYESEAGKLITPVLDIEAIADTFKVDWGDIPAHVGKCLMILKQERNRHQIEQIENSKNHQGADWSKTKGMG